jgi:hypothetical protein
MGVSIKGRPVSIGWATGASGGGSGGSSSGGGGRGGGASSLVSAPPSDTACSLFIGGLPAWSSPDEDREGEGEGGEAGLSRIQLEAALLGLFPGSTEVHLLGGKSYAFLDFRDHAAASATVQKYTTDSASFLLPGGGAREAQQQQQQGGEGEGKGALTVGWAQGKPSRRVAQGQGGEYDNSASHNADCWCVSQRVSVAGSGGVRGALRVCVCVCVCVCDSPLSCLVCIIIWQVLSGLELHQGAPHCLCGGCRVPLPAARYSAVQSCRMCARGDAIEWGPQRLSNV